MSNNAVRIYPLGDEALVCESPPPATLDVQRHVWAVAALARDWAPVREVVPGMNNLTITFDPLSTDADALAAQLAAAWRNTDVTSIAGRDIDIPVEYGGEFGPDLETVAAHAQLTPQQVAERHAAGQYIVFFVGFQPGFAYLGGLDASLFTPRRKEPRMAVPVGSVGIGGEQTGIYPATSPGGWQLIGRTALALFDPSRKPPALLMPGDRVRFTIAGVHA
ncbi:MAG TPA: 5-oxoprolinase subunit PxpB [Paraburkholderia sp.]|jgi:KipI family sensor histidine kinase inhibitor|nr:5-oxoprolinase subunit PxpB [Paraburkholderia sp.]